MKGECIRRIRKCTEEWKIFQGQIERSEAGIGINCGRWCNRLKISLEFCRQTDRQDNGQTDIQSSVRKKLHSIMKEVTDKQRGCHLSDSRKDKIQTGKGNG